MMRSLVALALPLLAAAQLAAPEFQIDLDLPPNQRHREVARYFKGDFPNIMITWEQKLMKLLPGEERAQWLGNHSVEQEFQDEIRGFVEEIDHPKVTFERVLLFNLMYEIGSSTWCSGIIACDSEGHVMHGRNLDFVFDYKSGRAKRHLYHLAANYTYYRGGAPVFTTPSWAGYVGLQTVLKLNGHHPWSFQQNSHPDNNKRLNLLAQQSGAVPFGFYMRRLVEQDVDFRTASYKIASTRFSAPNFFMMAGSAPWEGASMEITRNSSDVAANLLKVQVLSPAIGRWFLVQTNDRVWDEPQDDRRPAAVEMIAKLGSPQEVTQEHMMGLMREEPLFNKHTLFSVVMVPATRDCSLLQQHEWGPQLNLLAKNRRYKVFRD